MAEGSQDSGTEGQGISKEAFIKRVGEIAKTRQALVGESGAKASEQQPKPTSVLSEPISGAYRVSDLRKVLGSMTKQGREAKDQGLTDPEEFARRSKEAGEIRTKLEGPPQSPTPPAPKGPTGK